MGSLRDELINSVRSGTLLQSIYSNTPRKRDGRETLAAELAALHNEGAIDIIAAFSSLKNTPDQDIDFFLMRHLFENALPQIAAPVRAVMYCVYHLLSEAGQDLAAGRILEPFVAFCAEDEARPQEALKEIESSAGLLDLLVPTLVAGSRIDPEQYLAEALRLTRDESAEFRARAVLALGRLERMGETELRMSALPALERTITEEDDDKILEYAIMSLSSLMRQSTAIHDRAIGGIDRALAKGGDYARHAASELVAFDTDILPAGLLDTLNTHLLRINPNNTGTLQNLDFGIAHLLENGEQLKGSKFLEELLLRNSNEVSLDSFKSSAGALLSDKPLRNRLVTLWLLRGEPVLCRAVRVLISSVHGNPLELEADPDELKPADRDHIIFAARKAIGYLFFSPVSAITFLISLMRLTSDDETLAALGQHLFDPLLVNYTGGPLRYVRERASREPEHVASTLSGAIGRVENYLEGLQDIGTLPELHPGVAQREAYHRHQSRAMVEAYKEAEQQSVFLSVVHKSVLLYGHRSIHYVYGPDGHAHRNEIRLHPHTTELEGPRRDRLDPVGLDYMLRVFRAERMRT